MLSHIPVQKWLRGYIGHHSGEESELHHLKGGCDEVRLLATRENGDPFDEHVVSLKTTGPCLRPDAGGWWIAPGRWVGVRTGAMQLLA